jgi:hypothetical protein
MNTTHVDPVVQAVLYEGYILYPYRPSSKKNSRERFTFGRVYPQAYHVAQSGAERYVMQTECLVESKAPAAKLEVSVRFLQPMWREVGELVGSAANAGQDAEPKHRVVAELKVAGKLYQTWLEALERRVEPLPVALESGKRCSVSHPFAFPAFRNVESIPDNQAGVGGLIVRRAQALKGVVELEARAVAAECFKVTLRLLNLTPVPPAVLTDPDAILMRTFASAHTLLHIRDGEFVSLTDPPPRLQALAGTCDNQGTWPVLVGDENQQDRHMLLSSPIILYDYPKVAPESGGDFCDGTEIDEMLILRVMTLTDEEKGAMRNVDAVARKILERAESTSAEQFLKMHGTMRGENAMEFFNPSQRRESAWVSGTEIKVGDKVCLRPKGRADAFDLLLAGRTAIVEAVEQDAEDRIYLAVVLEDDPGQDLGWMRQPGHRFFFGLDEIEPLGEAVP